ncbi:transposase [Microbacterium sp. BWT-B31]|uniref:transposase n=1 Tax=Microbacterium sp. BWT-B31 TaxID=3232072 RepID=UPI003528774A
MARKNDTDEFRQRAVDLYESTPGETLKGIAADLGISRGALREWALKRGSGMTTVGAAQLPHPCGRQRRAHTSDRSRGLINKETVYES